MQRTSISKDKCNHHGKEGGKFSNRKSTRQRKSSDTEHNDNEESTNSGFGEYLRSEQGNIWSKDKILSVS